MRSSGRRDSNHAEIRDLLRAMPGMVVIDAGGWRNAGFDIIAVYQERQVAFIEIKAHGKAKLTDSERGAKKHLAPYWHRVNSIDEAFAVFGLSAEVAPF